MRVHEVQIGYKFQHGKKGECEIIKKTKRTITIKHHLGMTKVTYRFEVSYFSPSDF